MARQAWRNILPGDRERIRHINPISFNSQGFAALSFCSSPKQVLQYSACQRAPFSVAHTSEQVLLKEIIQLHRRNTS